MSTYATDIAAYVVEGCNARCGWEPVAAYQPGVPEQLLVSDTVSVRFASRCFLRLRVTLSRWIGVRRSLG